MGSSITNRTIPVNKRGSDCSGSDGAANRTLTITEGPVLDNIQIVIGGRVLHPTEDYTLSGNVITFLVNVDNTDYIRLILGR